MSSTSHFSVACCQSARLFSWQQSSALDCNPLLLLVQLNRQLLMLGAVMSVDYMAIPVAMKTNMVRAYWTPRLPKGGMARTLLLPRLLCMPQLARLMLLVLVEIASFVQKQSALFLC